MGKLDDKFPGTSLRRRHLLEHSDRLPRPIAKRERQHQGMIQFVVNVPGKCLSDRIKGSLTKCSRAQYHNKIQRVRIAKTQRLLFGNVTSPDFPRGEQSV